MLPKNEQQRLLALREKEEAEFNDDTLNAIDKAKAAQNAKAAEKRVGSINGNALNGLTAEQRSEQLLGLGGKRSTRKRKRSIRKRSTQKRYSKRSRHAR
jgi:hypothetical protein